MREAGYHVAFKGEKAYNGVALVAREKPGEVRFGFDDGGPEDAARLVTAKVGSLRVVNAYVPQGRALDHPMYPYKLEWFRRLKTLFDARFSTRMRLLFTGDLNVAPGPDDVYRPETKTDHVCFHEDVRKAFEDTKAWGFEDVFRKHHPEPEQYTFFDYRQRNSVKNKRGWRIDHLLATPPLANRCRDAFIDLEPRLREKPSDHTFLVADFDI